MSNVVSSTRLGTFTYHSVSFAEPETNEPTMVRFNTSKCLDSPAFVAWLNSKAKQGTEGAGDLLEIVVNCDNVVFYLPNRVQDEVEAVRLTMEALKRIQKKVCDLKPDALEDMLSPIEVDLRMVMADQNSDCVGIYVEESQYD